MLHLPDLTFVIHVYLDPRNFIKHALKFIFPRRSNFQECGLCNLLSLMSGLVMIHGVIPRNFHLLRHLLLESQAQCLSHYWLTTCELPLKGWNRKSRTINNERECQPNVNFLMANLSPLYHQYLSQYLANSRYSASIFRMYK